MGTREPMDVVLLFDTEDIFSEPEVGNDDSIKDLADIMTEEGLRGTFLFIGDRALHLRDRGRRDVTEAVARHEVGLHTRSALHPTSPEYVQKKSFADGLAEALPREREGVQIIEDVFGRPCCALSTHYNFGSVQSHRAAGILGLPYIYAFPAAPPLYNLSWYTGALCFPWSSPTLPGDRFLPYYDGFDSDYHDDSLFARRLEDFASAVGAAYDAGQPFMSTLLYHPQRVRLAEFIDRQFSPNGYNFPREQWGKWGYPRRYAPEQVTRNLVNFRRLIRWIRDDGRLRPTSVAEVAAAWSYQPATIDLDELATAARAIVAGPTIPIPARFSAAEILVGLADALVAHADSGALPDTVRRRDVMGPTRNPVGVSEILNCDWATQLGWARSVIEHVDATGHLPAIFGEPGDRIGINHLNRLFAEAFVAIVDGQALESFDLARELPRYPVLAVEIGRRFMQVAEGGLFDPDLDVDALYRHGKLQTWTLKPAIRR